MLGWEFPPIISGGLGLASQGLSQALAKLTKLCMIVPSAEGIRFPLPSELISLTKLSKQTAEALNPQEFPFIQAAESHIQSLSTYLSPYQSEQLEEELQAATFAKSTPGNKQGIHKLLTNSSQISFQLKEAYGHDLLSQFLHYSKLAVQLALTKTFDLIHAHDWLTFLAAIELKQQTGKPLVLHIHALEYDRGGPDRKGWVYELEKYAMQEADLIIAVSSYTAQIISSRYEIDADKIISIHNGLTATHPYKKDTAFPEKLILFMGRITAQKGPQTFLKSAKELLKTRQDVRFVMAGEGDLKKIMMQEVARFRLGDRFHFTGFLEREKVYDLLSMADICVMPSHSEPFGLVALEAAAFGLPTVISQYSGVAEVLHHAPKVEPSEIRQITGEVLRLLEDETHRERLGKQLQEDAKGMSWEKAAEKVMHVYGQLLK